MDRLPRGTAGLVPPAPDRDRPGAAPRTAPGRRRRPLLSRVGLVSLSDEIASVAESVERHVKTVDALHLATALVVADPVVVVTHDATMAAVAGHLGLDVEDPVA